MFLSQTTTHFVFPAIISALVMTCSCTFNPDIISGFIDSGASLVGTTVDGIKAAVFSVAVSGSIENYSRFSMQFIECEVASGHINVPIGSVASGLREGFASHKVPNSAKGSWVRCSFKTDQSIVHFMYSAPYSFDLHSNTLSLAVCEADDTDCQDLTANAMYYGSRPYMKRRSYYNKVYDTHICNAGFCISGTMGTTHKPTINLRVYPMDFDDLAFAVKDSAPIDRWDPVDYKNFINSI